MVASDIPGYHFWYFWDPFPGISDTIQRPQYIWKVAIGFFFSDYIYLPTYICSRNGYI